MKRRIILLGIISLLLLWFPMSEQTDAAETIMISTPEELDAVRNDLDGNYMLANDIDMSGFYTFEPIGNETDGAFTGTFDGNGYSIKNLVLNYETYKYVGLFGYLDGSVSNVHLDNADVVGGRYVGGIAGYADGKGSVTGCSVSGQVDVKPTYFTSYLGGIVGRSECDIADCVNEAVMGIKSSNIDYIAGIVGYSSKNINNCKNNGEINSSSLHMAGITGQANKIENSINIGKITNRSALQSTTCGIGEAEEIVYSYNTGDIDLSLIHI